MKKALLLLLMAVIAFTAAENISAKGKKITKDKDFDKFWAEFVKADDYWVHEHTKYPTFTVNEGECMKWDEPSKSEVQDMKKNPTKFLELSKSELKKKEVNFGNINDLHDCTEYDDRTEKWESKLTHIPKTAMGAQVSFDLGDYMLFYIFVKLDGQYWYISRFGYQN